MVSFDDHAVMRGRTPDGGIVATTLFLLTFTGTHADGKSRISGKYYHYKINRCKNSAC
jgi:hypothetical protein